MAAWGPIVYGMALWDSLDEFQRHDYQGQVLQFQLKTKDLADQHREDYQARKAESGPAVASSQAAMSSAGAANVVQAIHTLSDHLVETLLPRNFHPVSVYGHARVPWLTSIESRTQA